jgi:hypothetical protein
VAYRLQLPPGAKLHDVFHVGLLKKYYGELPTTPGTLSPIQHGRACLKPAGVTKSKLARRRHELLMQWKGLSAADATWVDLDEFRHAYPYFQLVLELIVCLGGGMGEMSCGDFATNDARRRIKHNRRRVRGTRRRQIRTEDCAQVGYHRNKTSCLVC